MRVRWGIFVAGTMATSLAACRCERPPGTSTGLREPEGSSARGAAEDWKAVVLFDDETLDEAMWTGNGAVVARSRRRFWWFRPEDGGRARTTVLAGDAHYPHLATAKSVDVSVVTSGGKAHVFHGPKLMGAFAVVGDVKTLSSDGALFVTESMRSSPQAGSTFHGGIYEAETGKRLSEHDSVPILSPTGEWALAGDRITVPRTGEEIVKLPEPAYFVGDRALWFDGGVMAWTKSGLVVADPKARKVVTVPAACKEGEIDELIELVDVATKQAVRFCGARVIVIRWTGSAPVVVELRVPPSRRDSKPTLAFARDDGAPLLVYGYPVGGEVDRIDFAGRSIAKTKKGIERTASRTNDDDGVASPDGHFRLRVDTSLSRLGEVMVVDVMGKDVVHLGASQRGSADLTIAPFLHEHGLEVIGGGSAKPTRLRVGPDATPVADLPRLVPDGGCAARQEDTSPPPPQRTLTGGAAIFEWPTGGSCVCGHRGCADPKLPEHVLARRDDKLIVAGVQDQSEVTYLERREAKGSASLAGDLRGAAYLDDGAGAVLLTQRRTSTDDLWRVSEVTLPGFEPRGEAVEIPHPYFYGWDYTLYGTTASLVVLMSDRSMLKGWVIARRRLDSGTTRPARLEAWDDNAVIRLPDGRIDLVGPKAARAVVCIDGAGVATPLDTCRARFIAKGAFRIE